MSPFADDLIFNADFNAVDPDDWSVMVSLWHGWQRRIPKPGERIYLRDAEGNRCWAVVQRVHVPTIWAELDETTWRAGDEDRVPEVTAFRGPRDVVWERPATMA